MKGEKTMIELLDYETSLLDPALKLITCVLFLVIALIYYDARKTFGGNVQSFTNYLFFFSIFFAVASIFRFLGHGIDFGFTPDYSLKWFQSLVYVAGGICLIVAAKKLLTIFYRGSS
jgi:hypothetical protein